LKADIVEAIECLHWWIKQGLVKNVLTSLEVDSMDVEAMSVDDDEDIYG
jgi:hypothetical protein